MLEKPKLQEDRIAYLLQRNYDLAVVSVEFLPLGHDPNSWVYKVRTDSTPYFLKLKKGKIYEPSVEVPWLLAEKGTREVLAPIKTNTEELWIEEEDSSLTLYPFVDGKTGRKAGMSDEQWRQFGSALKRIHSIKLPDSQSKKVTSETFIPTSTHLVMDLHSKVKDMRYEESLRKELALFWHERHEEIGRIIERTEELGRQTKTSDLDFVLCHTDIHTDNILLSDQGQLFIIDWDDPLLAPKERDLMFFVGKEKEQLFFDGYGKIEIDLTAIAYYCYALVVQEIGDYGKQVFLSNEVEEKTRQAGVQEFIELFDAGGVVESAYQADEKAGNQKR